MANVRRHSGSRSNQQASPESELAEESAGRVRQVSVDAFPHPVLGLGFPAEMRVLTAASGEHFCHLGILAVSALSV